MRTDTKTHTDISVTDNSTDVTVYAPDPQIRQNYDAFVKYIRDLELKMRGYDTNEDTGPKPIASYRAAGKTNEDADRAVLKDLTGNGHDLQLKNFAWSGMSGFGGYSYNFAERTVFEDYGPNAGATRSSDTLYIEKVSKSNVNWRIKLDQFKCQLKITGVTEAINSGEIQQLRIYSSKDVTNSINVKQDGVYDIDISPSTSTDKSYIYVFANSPQYDLNNPLTLTTPIALEQLPLYPDALVFDGIDDYAVCENFPILTREKGYTVIAIRTYFSKEKGCFLSNRVANDPNNNAFNVELYQGDNRWTRSFSTANQGLTRYPQTLTYQTSKQYNDQEITIEQKWEIGVNTIYLGTLSNVFQYMFKGAFYALDIYDRTLEGEELQIALNNIEK